VAGAGLAWTETLKALLPPIDAATICALCFLFWRQHRQQKRTMARLDALKFLAYTRVAQSSFNAGSGARVVVLDKYRTHGLRERAQ